MKGVIFMLISLFMYSLIEPDFIFGFISIFTVFGLILHLNLSNVACKLRNKCNLLFEL
jgi:hypothetical protein